MPIPKTVLTRISREDLDIELRYDDQATTKITLNAVDIEKLIGVLVNYRATMPPETARELPPVHALAGPSDPLFVVYDVAVLPGKMLAIRHPGIGWLGFLFPKAEAEKLAQGLLAEGPKQTTDPHIPTDRLQ